MVSNSSSAPLSSEYHCGQCNTTFTRIRDRIRHDKSVHGKGERYRCSYCEKTFTRKDSRVRHEHQCKKDKPIKVIQKDSKKKKDDGPIPMEVDSSSGEDDDSASKKASDTTSRITETSTDKS